MSGEYKKNQAFWHVISSLVYVGLLVITMQILVAKGSLPTNLPLFDFFILGFAIFRLIRLFVYDSVTSFIREYFLAFEKGPKRTIGNLLDCPWCTGVWMALAVIFFYFLTPLAWYPLFVLAMAGVGTYLQLIILRIGHNL